MAISPMKAAAATVGPCFGVTIIRARAWIAIQSRQLARGFDADTAGLLASWVELQARVGLFCWSYSEFVCNLSMPVTVGSSAAHQLALSASSVAGFACGCAAIVVPLSGNNTWTRGLFPAGLKLVDQFADWLEVRFYNLSWEFWHPRILTDLARGIDTLLKFDHSTIVGNYGHYTRVLVDVDLAGFVPKKLLLETTDDCIEAPPSVPTTNVFEVLNTDVISTHIEDMIHHHDAVPSTIVDINTEMGIEVRLPAPDLGATPTMTEFNIETSKSIQTTSKSDRTPSHHSTVPHQVMSWVDAFGDSNDELDDYGDDKVEDKWPTL
ncbi:hypothetical protein FNV43_RR07335 [Rhamnella rubrinervis]|uniref:Uncharacterized protein n=1 Tax=Rhamnella rubrinervis TaxID=2594499 RepID=A0A8K0HF56_9ROSA|nr:hypothetical protein FNV43_RR07335 [Rhamnella rubrinervis]